MKLIGILFAIVVVIAIMGTNQTSPSTGDGHSSSDWLDFGDCHRLDYSAELLQSCTYKDGHTEILKLSDMTGR